MGGGPIKDHLVITLPGPEPEALTKRLRHQFPDTEVVYHQIYFDSTDKERQRDAPTDLYKDATILFTVGKLPQKASDVPKLDFVQLASAGSNWMEKNPIYTDTDVTISTASGIHGPQIAEWVVMTALVHSHKYKQLYELQKQHEWGKKSFDSDYHSVRDKVGQRLGVLGYGSIGRQVGRVARAMGMDVVAYTASPKDTDEKKKDRGFIVPGTGDPDGEIPSAWFSGLDKESLHHFLSQDIDVLLVSVPLTKETKHMLSTEEFRILSKHGKRRTLVTNIARGPIIDQSALIESLKDGTLDGAALDVTDPEPLPKDSELWDLPNAIVTPHVSGVGEAYMDRAFQVLALNMEKRKKGEKLINVVRRDRGY